MLAEAVEWKAVTGGESKAARAVALMVAAAEVVAVAVWPEARAGVGAAAASTVVMAEVVEALCLEAMGACLGWGAKEEAP